VTADAAALSALPVELLWVEQIGVVEDSSVRAVSRLCGLGDLVGRIRAGDQRGRFSNSHAVSAAQASSRFPSRLCCGSRIASPVSRSIFKTPVNPNGT
jgi:hypothetical protein